MTFGTFAFTSPWLLVVLAALPILWFLLRAIPPSPTRRIFPAVSLLVGLRDDDSVSDRTPWWLMLLRLLAVAAVIIGLAGPVLNPKQSASNTRSSLLIVMDASWASAENWAERIATADQLLSEAGRNGRTAAIVTLTDVEAPVFQATAAWQSRLAGLTPKSWAPTPASMQQLPEALPKDMEFETIWFSDGLDRDGRADLLNALSKYGDVTAIQSAESTIALEPVVFSEGALKVTAKRNRSDAEKVVYVQAIGRDPTGVERVLSDIQITFDPSEATAERDLELPAELRNRLTSFRIRGARNAGAVALTDDNLRKREIALVAERQNREGLELLSPLHYIRQAFAPSAPL